MPLTPFQIGIENEYGLPPTSAAYAASGGYGGGAAAPAPAGFNLNPAPQVGPGRVRRGSGAASGLPNPAADLETQMPGLSGLNQNRKPGHTIPPWWDTFSRHAKCPLQNAGATFGVESGMPGSGLTWNSIYGNIAGASAAQQQQGLQSYSQFHSHGQRNANRFTRPAIGDCHAKQPQRRRSESRRRRQLRRAVVQPIPAGPARTGRGHGGGVRPG